MRKIFTLFFVALFSVGLWADGEYGPTGKVIYLDISNGSTDYWRKDQASLSYKVKMYYNNSDDSKEIIGAFCCERIGSSSVYYTKTTDSFVRYMQALRCAGSCGDQYNYSSRVACSARDDDSQNCIYLKSENANWWDTWTPGWKTYAPPMSSVALADNNTEVVGGTGTSEDPYLVPAGVKIKVIASGEKAVPDDNANINFDFKEGETSQQDGTEDTYEFDASNVINTTYTINLDGYTKVSTTESEKLAATALYYKTVDPAYVTLAASITDDAYINEAITVTATAHNTEATNYAFYENDALEPAQSSASATFSYTPTTKGDKTIKVIMTYAGGTKQATVAISVEYEKWDIYVENNCSWGTMMLYFFEPEPTAWPGVGCEPSTVTGSWYKVTLDDKYAKFIVNNGANEQTVDNTLSKENQPANTTWQFVFDHEDKDKGKKYYYFTRSYVVSFGIGEVAGTEGTISTAPAITTGDYVAQGTEITFTRPAAKTGYIFKGWYANTSGTGDALGTNETYEVTISGTINVYAVYEVDSASALDEAADSKKAVKRIVNGQLVIEREGKLFNALGAEVK